MVNVKAGLLVSLFTFILVLIQAVLGPIIFQFLQNMNDTSTQVQASTVAQNLLVEMPGIYVLAIFFTILGGALASIFAAIALPSNA